MYECDHVHHTVRHFRVICFTSNKQNRISLATYIVSKFLLIVNSRGCEVEAPLDTNLKSTSGFKSLLNFRILYPLIEGGGGMRKKNNGTHSN